MLEEGALISAPSSLSSNLIYLIPAIIQSKASLCRLCFVDFVQIAQCRYKKFLQQLQVIFLISDVFSQK
ncbi:MAG: hypothetical protein B7X08_05930 [Acidocella sp. 20-63-7]|nr:MAG: hypothetical protein B7X08_05930 [Acidocella sp. 20-63-7]